MVASNVSSNHGPHATIALDSVGGGIHEDGWFPVTNTRSYGEQAVHPLVHEADEELSYMWQPGSRRHILDHTCGGHERSTRSPFTPTLVRAVSPFPSFGTN